MAAAAKTPWFEAIDMRTASRFIPGEEIGSVAQWRFGDVDSEALSAFERERARLDAEAQARDAVARQQGYAEGFEQGRLQAEQDAQRRLESYLQGQGQETAQRLAQVIASAGAQMEEAAQQMARSVLELGCEVARSVLRQELSVNPNVLQPLIREALSVLAEQGKAASVRLHPLDLDMMGDALRAEFASLSLVLVPDAGLSPGGCLVSSAGTVVDATLQGRWQRALAQIGIQSVWES